MKIRLEYEELENLVHQLNNQEEIFNQCVNQLNTLIHSIPDSWDGNAAKAYVSEFDSLQPSFDQTRGIIEMLQSQINESMAIMKEKDELLAGKLNF